MSRAEIAFPVRFEPMGEAQALKVARWRHGSPYSMYDTPEDGIAGTVSTMCDPRNGYFAVIDATGSLVAHRCFGQDARVPGYAYDDTALDTGGGLRPDLTGRGLGPAVIRAGLQFGLAARRAAAFRVTVAALNVRALRAVETLGFREAGRFHSSASGDEYVVLRLDDLGLLADAAASPLPAHIAALPKADLHVHAEGAERLERILARERGEAPLNRRAWLETLARLPPGMPRLLAIGADDRAPDREAVDALVDRPDYLIARIADVLEEGAADGAAVIEVIFGASTILAPDFMSLFHEAVARVRTRFPLLRAGALIAASRPTSEEWLDAQLPACLAASREGLSGVNIIPDPYDREIDWAVVHGWAERARDVGLGLTAHAGEFSTANVAGALRTPGLTRIGHAVYAARDPQLLEQLAAARATVECCLTSNVVLGAVASLEHHPIRALLEYGVPVTLATDDPVRLATTIGREYAAAAQLGFDETALLQFTKNGERAAFVR